LSTYDGFIDGAGVCFSSYKRPILNMRPKYRMALASVWQFPADLSIIGWLEHQGYDYEVLTDEDLHRDGAACLKPYAAVIAATHPEYYSERMMDGTEDYLANGGRLIYMGGNGYYWVVSFSDEEPWCMEVRKGESGSRAWQAMPGEYYNQTEGVRSGLWKCRGRPPQKLVGVGFSTEGFDTSGSYTKMPDAKDAAMAWIFDKVDSDSFGDSGLALGGAAGLELDRYDLLLGTPPHTRLLATSQGLSDNYPRVGEEIYYNFPGQGATQDYQCRADMVYFTTAKNGAVFAPGSIAWASSLPSNNFNNSVSTIMGNVLNAFLREGPLPE
jgi:N,N-dimethylformamidase